jgi:hypothetical protein
LRSWQNSGHQLRILNDHLDDMLVTMFLSANLRIAI